MSTIITRSRSKIIAKMNAKIELRTRLLTKINNLNTDLMLTSITDFEEGTTYFIQFQLGCCDNSEINELSEKYTGLYEYIGLSPKRFEDSFYKNTLLFKSEFGRVVAIVKKCDRSYYLIYENTIYLFKCLEKMIDYCCSNSDGEFFQCNIFKQETSSDTEFVLK